MAKTNKSSNTTNTTNTKSAAPAAELPKVVRIDSRASRVCSFDEAARAYRSKIVSFNASDSAVYVSVYSASHNKLSAVPVTPEQLSVFSRCETRSANGRLILDIAVEVTDALWQEVLNTPLKDVIRSIYKDRFCDTPAVNMSTTEALVVYAVYHASEGGDDDEDYGVDTELSISDALRKTLTADPSKMPRNLKRLATAEEIEVYNSVITLANAEVARSIEVAAAEKKEQDRKFKEDKKLRDKQTAASVAVARRLQAFNKDLASLSDKQLNEVSKLIKKLAEGK